MNCATRTLENDRREERYSIRHVLWIMKNFHNMDIMNEWVLQVQSFAIEQKMVHKGMKTIKLGEFRKKKNLDIKGNADWSAIPFQLQVISGIRHIPQPPGRGQVFSFHFRAELLPHVSGQAVRSAGTQFCGL